MYVPTATAMDATTLAKSLVAAGVSVFCCAAMALSTEFPGTVVAVSDAEVITVQHNGELQTIRLNGVECPDQLRLRARQYLSKLLLGKQVTVVTLERDARGRTIADVFLPGGEMLNGEVIRLGLAWTDGTNYAMFSDLEDEARAAKRGMWSHGGHPRAPAQNRPRRHAPPH
jgi:micrococcal nuclease